MNRELTYTSCYPTSDGGVTIAVATPSGALRYVSMTVGNALRLAGDIQSIAAHLVDSLERSARPYSDAHQ